MMKIKMYKKFLSVILLAVVTLFAGTAVGKYIPYKGSAAAAEKVIEVTPKKSTEDHSAQALEHAIVAATHGKAGHASVLTEHAKVALKHAQAAEQALNGEAREHMTKGIEHLNEAIKHGEMDHADMATEHVNEAITHIKASIGE
ncbi:MAG: small metal-binding protein SmbP [Gammaproteobacteria bacterium]